MSAAGKKTRLKRKSRKAVALTGSNPRRPERDQYPEDEGNDRPKPPTICSNEHLSSGHGDLLQLHLVLTTHRLRPCSPSKRANDDRTGCRPVPVPRTKHRVCVGFRHARLTLGYGLTTTRISPRHRPIPEAGKDPAGGLRRDDERNRPLAAARRGVRSKCSS